VMDALAIIRPETVIRWNRSGEQRRMGGSDREPIVPTGTASETHLVCGQDETQHWPTATDIANSPWTRWVGVTSVPAPRAYAKLVA